jgi:hypothetical protein
LLGSDRYSVPDKNVSEQLSIVMVMAGLTLEDHVHEWRN